jgi:hypothetical protein
VILKNRFVGAFFVPLMGMLPDAVYAATLNISGDITLSGAKNGTIMFNLDPVQAGATFRVNTSDGLFAPLAGTFGTESTSLSGANAPVNTLVNIPGFLTFLSNPNVTFTLTELLGGNLGPCTATANACTPAGTPFNLVNTSASSSSASFTVIGNFIINGTTQPGMGVYSASFANQRLQQVLAAFTSPGTVLVASSNAQFTTPGIPETTGIPEPNTAYMVFGSGLVLLGLRSLVTGLRKRAE